MIKLYQIKQLWQKHNARVVLYILLIIFFVFTLFIATNLQRGIIPDEPAHFAFSKHYSTTLGLPPDVYETYSWGWYIEQNPFLYHWLNGRIINLIDLTYPNIQDWHLLIVLRIVNSIYALGSIFVVYLISTELIKNKWWRLLPVFMLTNTLMFVFLAGGVNYDNFAILLCNISLYFLIRVFNKHNFIINSLGWMISISGGTLVKYTILPLALIMGIVWIIYFFKNRISLSEIKLKKPYTIILITILIALVFINFSIYGINLIKYKSLLPPCHEILSESECKISPFARRYDHFALDPKLSIAESIKLGYPNPIEYLIKSWLPVMLARTYGILGHKVYNPVHSIFWFEVLIYWTIMLFFKFWRKQTFTNYSLIWIVIFYAFILFGFNYNTELVYGFKNWAMQGRYIFPVLSLAYVLFTKLLSQIPKRLYRTVTVIYVLILFFFAGPIKLLYNYNVHFSEWFIVN